MAKVQDTIFILATGRQLQEYARRQTAETHHTSHTHASHVFQSIHSIVHLQNSLTVFYSTCFYSTCFPEYPLFRIQKTSQILDIVLIATQNDQAGR